jgi:hypothetical protein
MADHTAEVVAAAVVVACQTPQEACGKLHVKKPKAARSRRRPPAPIDGPGGRAITPTLTACRSAKARVDILLNNT